MRVNKILKLNIGTRLTYKKDKLVMPRAGDLCDYSYADLKGLLANFALEKLFEQSSEIVILFNLKVLPD